MRHAVRKPRSWHRSWKVIPASLFAFVGWGCAQPPYCVYYGYGAPPCGPGHAGPDRGGLRSAARRRPGAGGDDLQRRRHHAFNRDRCPQLPRVVVSEPDSGFHLRLKRSDPEASIATTNIEGAVSDSTVNR